jgi:hypothetical protein
MSCPAAGSELTSEEQVIGTTKPQALSVGSRLPSRMILKTLLRLLPLEIKKGEKIS